MPTSEAPSRHNDCEHGSDDVEIHSSSPLTTLRCLAHPEALKDPADTSLLTYFSGS